MFNISFDHFGRYSIKQNCVLTQHFSIKLWENDYIEEVEESQIYSLDDKRFLPDRYITGTCPACGYEKARGDQCENCTKQLDPTDLIDPESTISGSKLLEIRQTRHLFLKQSLLKNKLEKWINTKEKFYEIFFATQTKIFNCRKFIPQLKIQMHHLDQFACLSHQRKYHR